MDAWVLFFFFLQCLQTTYTQTHTYSRNACRRVGDYGGHGLEGGYRTDSLTLVLPPVYENRSPGEEWGGDVPFRVKKAAPAGAKEQQQFNSLGCCDQYATLHREVTEHFTSITMQFDTRRHTYISMQQHRTRTKSKDDDLCLSHPDSTLVHNHSCLAVTFTCYDGKIGG